MDRPADDGADATVPAPTVRSDRWHRALIENSADAIALFRPGGEIVYGSPATVRILGYADGDFVGRNAFDLVHPEDMEAVAEGIRWCLAAPRRQVELAARVRHHDGSWRSLEGVLTNLVDDPDVGAIVNNYRDATDRRRAESAVRASEQGYRDLFDNAADAIAIVDAAGAFTSANHAALELTGYRNLEETAGRMFLDLVSPEQHARMRELFEQGLAGVPTTALYRVDLVHRDGHLVPVEISVRPLREHGKPLAFQVVARDVRVRWEAERALRESEERYRRFFEDDLAGAYVTTADGRLLDCNPAFARIFGLAGPEHALGTDVTSFYGSPEERLRFVDRVRRQGRLEYHEFAARRADGSAAHLVENAIGEFDADGRLLRIRGYLFDDTERRRLADDLRQAQKMDAIGRLAGGVAHDFNNMLGVIRGYAELGLRGLGAEEPIRRHLSNILHAAERASALTQQLLAFSRKDVASPRVLDPNAAVVDMHSMLQRLIGEHIELVTDLSDEPGMVFADPGQLQQVILNLCVNARDAMPGGGRLRITTARRPASGAPGDPSHGFAVLTVEDTGTGMPEEVQARVFEPFFTTKPPGQGTGLGLSTVYGIVKACGGHVELTSAPGQGSRFRVCLPCCAGDETREVPATAPAVGGSETILLSEDEEALRLVMQEVLESSGYHVLPARDGPDALRVAESHPGRIDLLVTDLVMPGMSGVDLAERVRERRPETPVLYVSGYPGEELARTGVAREALAKPFTWDALLDAVRSAIDGTAMGTAIPS